MKGNSKEVDSKKETTSYCLKKETVTSSNNKKCVPVGRGQSVLRHPERNPITHTMQYKKL